MTDPTVLNQAAETLLAVLVKAAGELGWEPDSSVAAGEPSYDCDSIYVWLSTITPETDDGGCVVASNVELSYSIAECVGAERDETSIFTNAPQNQDKIWTLYTALASACCSTALLGPNSDIPQLGTLNLTTTDGGVTIYTGTVTAVLSPVENT